MFTYLQQEIIYDDTTSLLVNSVANVIARIAREKTPQDNHHLTKVTSQLQKTLQESDRLNRERITLTDPASLEAIRRENQLETIELEKRRYKYQFQLAVINLETPAIVNEWHREFIARLEQQKYEHNKGIAKYVKEIQQAIATYIEEIQWRLNQNSMEFQKWKAQQDRELSLHIKNLNAQISLNQADVDRQTQLLLLQQQFENGRNPIWSTSRQCLTNAELPALRVLLSPSIMGGFPLDQNEINSKLHMLADYYSDNQRPVKYFGDLFKGLNDTQQTAPQRLFADFKCVPMLILDAQLGREKFYLSYDFWGSNAEYISTGQFIEGLSLKHQNYIYVKREVIRWQQMRAKESEPGKIDSLYGAKNVERLSQNLKILEAEKQAQALGLDTDHFEYRVSQKQIQQTANYLVLLHCVNVGLWADIYFLLHAPTEEPLPPLLLEFLHTLDLLKDYSQDEISDLMAGLLDSYNKVYQVLANQGFAALVPELFLANAQACHRLKVFDLQQEQVNLSLEAWLKQRSVTPMGDTLLLLEIMKPLIATCDRPYLMALRQQLNQLGIHSYIDDILPFLNILQEQEDKAKWEQVILNQQAEADRQEQNESSKSLELGNALSLELVEIPAGSFKMGSNHEIHLKGFLMGKYPVTQKQYYQVMGKNPSYFKGDNLPVEQVTWHEAVKFCREVSAKTGQKVMLPTETQWQYAASATKTTPYFFGDSDSQLSEYAWYVENTGSKTHPVGEKKPNAWGLYDLLGNVWEWCQDDWTDDFHNLPKDGGPFQEDSHTNQTNPNLTKQIRGGSWYNTSSYCQSSSRYRYAPASRHYVIGFRVIVATNPADALFSTWHHRC